MIEFAAFFKLKSLFFQTPDIFPGSPDGPKGNPSKNFTSRETPKHLTELCNAIQQVLWHRSFWLAFSLDHASKVARVILTLEELYYNTNSTCPVLHLTSAICHQSDSLKTTVNCLPILQS